VDEQGLQERVDAGVAETEPGDAGSVAGDDGRGQGGECFRAADGVVADGLDAEQAPVGGKADLPQGGEVGQPAGQPEVLGVVNGGFRPDRLAQRRVGPAGCPADPPSE